MEILTLTTHLLGDAASKMANPIHSQMLDQIQTLAPESTKQPPNEHSCRISTNAVIILCTLHNLFGVLISSLFAIFLSNYTLTELCLCKVTLCQLSLATGIQVGREDG